MAQPMTDAKLRAIAKYGRDWECETWDEARYMVEHTIIGASYVLHEAVADLGRAIRGALPGPLRRLFEEYPPRS
jgi:hypothetical protein